MSFKSKMKTVGKIALKAAPIAAMFIPGVGPLASMAIGAATNAASKKIEGGSWKQSLLAGGVGAAEGYGAGALKAAGAAAKAGKAAAAAKGIAPTASKVSTMAKVMGGVNKGIQASKPILGAIGEIAASRSANNSGGALANSNIAQGRPNYGVNSGGNGYGGSGNPMDQSNPNLAYALAQGKREAIMNQPFRAGSEIRTENPDDANAPFITRTPPIFSLSGGRNRRRGLAAAQ